MQRITEKYLNQLADEYNQKYNLKPKQKGYIYINPVYGYYQLHQICQNGTDGVNNLESGTPKEIYNYILYRLDPPEKLTIEELKEKIVSGNYTKDDFYLVKYNDFIDLIYNYLQETKS